LGFNKFWNQSFKQQHFTITGGVSNDFLQKKHRLASMISSRDRDDRRTGEDARIDNPHM